MLSTKDGNYTESFYHLDRPKHVVDAKELTKEGLNKFETALNFSGEFLISLPSDKIEFCVAIKKEYHSTLAIKIREITVECLKLDLGLFSTRIRSGKYPEGHTICAHLMNKYTGGLTLTQMANVIGRKKDHTSVIYHIKRASRFIESKDEPFIKSLTEVESIFKQHLTAF